MRILFFSLILSSVVIAAPQKVERSENLMNLINQEMKILEAARGKGPELHYRMLELQSEKLKLIHEKNNREFMELSGKERGARDKESFFNETRSYYAKTKDFGLKLMKDFPKTNLRAQILFAMALNSRDYGRDNITEKFLLEAISLIRDPHHSLRHHAETALADFYYNEKRYQDAITYYQRAIKKAEDEWLTKHLFNLSWCYLKVREFDKAIETIKNSYYQSKNPSYVNIKDQVLENIGPFYVYAGRPLEGLEFYLTNEKDPISYLIPLALKASDKGHEKETQTILDSAQDLVNKNGWDKYQEELFHTYLDFYRHYNRFQDHEKFSHHLVDYYAKALKEKEKKLPVTMRDDAIEKMRSLAGFLQVKLAKDMKQDEANYEKSELDLVLKYFTHLIQLDAVKKSEYYYFRAETYYSVRLFEKSAPSYVETIKEAKIAKNEELARKALNSLLALTGMEVIEKESNKKFLAFAYSEHIGLWPVDEKSEQIYPKLFELYREQKDDVRATGVLRSYNKYYPIHLNDQQKLMTKILDQFIEGKDTVKLANWIEEFKKGFLSFPKQTIEKTEIVLGNILFLQYQEMAKNGEKLSAAKGFESIYHNKLYPNKVKGLAGFYAAFTYIELGETVKSYEWQAMAYKFMTEEEKLARREEQLKLTERTYKLQDFVTAYKLSEFLLKKFCTLKDQTQTRFYEIAVMTSLIEEKPLDAEHIVKSFSHCSPKNDIKDIALAQIYNLYERQRDFYGLRLFVGKNKIDPYLTQYRYTLQKWYWGRGNIDFKEKIRHELIQIKTVETDNWIKEMVLYDQALKAKAQLEAEIIWNRPVFDGEAFNKSLENYLIKIQTFKTNYQSLIQSNQFDLAVLSTRMFSEVYLHSGLTISTMRPQGLDEATMKDFRMAMKQVSSQFTMASKQFEKQLEKVIKSKETLTWGARSIASVEKVENPIFSFFTGLPMDKVRE